MQELMELVGDFELTLTDLKVESMLNDLLENSSRVEQFDDFTRKMAKARSAGFLVDYVKALDVWYYHLGKYVEAQRKIATSSSQPASVEDERAIEVNAPTESGSALSHIVTNLRG